MDKFSEQVCQSIGFYVYALTNPLENDSIFYIGKGKDNRIFAHVKCVSEDGTLPDDLNDDSDLKSDTIKKILSKNKKPGMYIIRHSLTEREALLVEAALINVLDWQLEAGLTNKVAGHGTSKYGLSTVAEIETAFGKTFDIEKIPGNEKIVAININKKWPEVKTKDDILEVSKGYWRMGYKNAQNCKYAIIHANGIVRAVFEIKSWKKSEHHNNRLSFEIEKNEHFPIYPNQGLGKLLPRGTQNPIRYIR